MTVNQRLCTGSLQPLDGGSAVDLGVGGTLFVARLTLRPQRQGNGFTLCQRARQKSLLPGGLLHLLPERQVLGIGQAQRVTVREQPVLSGKLQHSRVCQQSGMTALHQGLANQKIAVTMHEKKCKALSGGAHFVCAKCFKAPAQSTFCINHVVTDPDFKHVAKHEDGVSRCALQVARPGVKVGGLLHTQMQVGNKVHHGP